MEFLRFIVAGAINTVVTYGLYILLLHFLGYLIAYSAAYAVGIVLSYWLNSVIVFRHSMSFRGFVRFPLVYVAQYAITATLLWVCVGVLGMTKEISLLAVMALTIPATFLAARLAILSGRIT